jgi:hypothetical protein
MYYTIDPLVGDVPKCRCGIHFKMFFGLSQEKASSFFAIVASEAKSFQMEFRIFRGIKPSVRISYPFRYTRSNGFREDYRDSYYSEANLSVTKKHRLVLVIHE